MKRVRDRQAEPAAALEKTATKPARSGSAATTARRSRRGAARGIHLATLVGFSAAGAPMLLVSEGGEDSRIVTARAAVKLEPDDAGRLVAVVFDGETTDPIAIGLIEPAVRPATEGAAGEDPDGRALELDLHRLVIDSSREIVFRCGEASITLTRSGKVLIRGAQILTRATGVNRIKGGSVQIN